MANDQAKHLRKSLETAGGKLGHTIAITSGKGGVGKSNIALNFSLELLNYKRSVLLIDLDVGMGNIDILLGLHAKHTIVDMIKDRKSIETIIESGPGQLSYIAGGQSLETLFSMTADDADYFLEEFDRIQAFYDFIIFDLGAGVSHDSLFFILAADEAFVVTTPEPTAITDAYGIIKHIVNLNDRLPLRLILNRTSSRRQAEQTTEQFKKVVKQFLNYELDILGCLPDDSRVAQAVIRQTPLILSKAQSPMAKGVRQMTSSYLGDKTGESNGKNLSFIDRFKRLLKKR